MSRNTETVARYMEAFGQTDRAAIHATLTDDVEWVIPGAFHVTGRAAFDDKIEDDAFEGHPTITVSRMTEQGDVVFAEGTARARRRDGVGVMTVAFCDVFELRDGRIGKLTSYVMDATPRTP